MQAIPLIIAAVGTAASMSAEKHAANERRDVLNRQLERDTNASDKAVSLVEQQGQNFSQEQRLQGLKDQETKAYDQAQNDIAGAGGANISTAADAGNVSGDFLKTKAARAIDEGTRLTSIAREQSKARAPGMLQQDDSLGMAGLAGNLQNIWGKTRNMANATGLDAQNVQAPLYGSLGKIAAAVGTSMAGSGYGAESSGGVMPPNPYATAGRGTAGINFGAR